MVRKDFLIGFHRTKAEDFVKGVILNGFKPDLNSTYGAGWYFNYNKVDWLGSNTYQYKGGSLKYLADKYGKYVFQCKIGSKGFIYFDTEPAKIVYGENFSIPKQVKMICPEAFEKVPWAEWPGKVFSRNEIIHYKERGFSSGLAKDFYKFFRNEPWFKKVKGLLYTGATDRHSFVAYDFHDVQFLSVKKDDGNEESPWMPVAKEAIKLALENNIQGIKNAREGEY